MCLLVTAIVLPVPILVSIHRMGEQNKTEMVSFQQTEDRNKDELMFVVHGVLLDLRNIADVFKPTLNEIRSGRHEDDEVAVVTEFVHGSAKVLEIGAGIGVISCVINRRLDNPSNHVAVEANPNLISTLIRTRDLNNAKFHIVHGIIGEEKNYVFHASTEYFLESNKIRPVQSSKETLVPGISLSRIERIVDSDCAEGCFDTLVLDIEGAEKEFFETYIEQLSRTIRLIIVELHGLLFNDPEEWDRQVISTIVSRGFQLVQIKGHNHVFLSTATGDGDYSSVSPARSPV